MTQRRAHGAHDRPAARLHARARRRRHPAARPAARPGAGAAPGDGRARRRPSRLRRHARARGRHRRHLGRRSAAAGVLEPGRQRASSTACAEHGVQRAVDGSAPDVRAASRSTTRARSRRSCCPKLFEPMTGGERRQRQVAGPRARPLHQPRDREGARRPHRRAARATRRARRSRSWLPRHRSCRRSSRAMRVLIVDDEADIRDSLAGVLRGRGLRGHHGGERRRGARLSCAASSCRAS